MRRLPLALLFLLAFAFQAVAQNTPFSYFDWYYSIGDESPSTQLFSTKRGIYVGYSDAQFQAWATQAQPPVGTIAVTGAVNNGSGLVRLTLTNVGGLDTTHYYTFIGVGGVSGANGIFQITNISPAGNSVDLVGSTFSGSYTSGGELAGVNQIDTQSNYYAQLNQFNISQDANGAYTALGGFVSGGSPINLLNPLAVTTQIEGIGADANDTVTLPPANLPNSPPIGKVFYIYVTAVTGSVASHSLTAQDGVTSEFSAPLLPGQLVSVQMITNITANGTWLINLVTPSYNNPSTVRYISSGTTDAASRADSLIAWNSSSSSAKTETLPSCSGSNRGLVITIKDQKGDAATNNITMVSGGASTINGTSSYPINTNRGGATFQCDGVSDWVLQAFTATGLSPGGTAGGSLTGTYPNPTLASIPNDTSMLGDILATNSAAPSTPSTGANRFWTDSTDKRLHDKNDTGAIGTTTVAQTCSANNWLSALSTAGVLTCSQPGFGNLSGTLSTAQMPAFGSGDVSFASGGGAGTIAAGAVTNAKMANMTGPALKGVVSGTSAPTDVSPANARTITEQGWTLISVNSIGSSQATYTDTTSINSTYDDYMIVVDNITPVTAGTNLEMLMHSGGAFQNTGYLNVAGGATAYVDVITAGGNLNSTEGVSFYCIIHNVNSTTQRKVVRCSGGYLTNAASFTNVNGAGAWNGGAGAVDGFEFLISSGNIASAFAIKVYGARKAL